ncbi:MAG: transcriptional regulator Spx [Streptococcaceae bacterium]|jgi:regulatory protein spx|nr:transcriptional regulator Spx [Streptococcaceae bacterium]
MLTIYTSPSCTSCRKARQWLDQHAISYIEKDLHREKISIEELKQILMLTERGTIEIFSSRSVIYKRYEATIDDLSVGQLLKLIQEHPKLLRRPILIDEKRLLIGFNEDDIRRFIPRKVRRLEMKDAIMRAGL